MGSSSRPNNLPVQRGTLIGRQRDAERLRELLLRDDVGLVSLLGPGGVGKTRLALHVATQLLEQFEGGAFLVSLASVSDPALVVPTIARTLGVRESGSLPTIDNLKARLRDTPTLLVLENFEHLVSAAADIADLLSASSVLKVLATSRAILQLSMEHACQLTPLDLPERLNGSLDHLLEYAAVQLFVERAQAARPDFELTDANASAVVGICAPVDGLPLAIELAAARVRLLPPAALLARLSEPLAVLTDGGRDAPPRHRRLRDTIGWSYELLDPPARALLRRLSVFAGGWSMHAAEAVCNSPSILTEMAALIDQSLIRPADDEGDERFSMLETVREFALEQLNASCEADEARTSHARYFAELVEAAEPHLKGTDAAARLGLLELEHDNVRAALGWLVEHDRPLALRLGAAVWRFWDMRGYFSEGRDWLARLLALEEASPPTETRAKLLAGHAFLVREHGDYALARRLLEASLGIVRELGDRAQLARALNNYGIVLSDMGDYAAACATYRESLDIRRELGDRAAIAQSLTNLGTDTAHLGDYAQARTYQQEALDIFRELDEAWSMAISLRGLASIAHEQQAYAEARAHLEECLAISIRLRVPAQIATCLIGLGGLAAAQHAPRRAAQLFGAAERLRETLGTPVPVEELRWYDAYVADARGKLDDESFAAAWAEGRGWSTELAIEHALRDVDVDGEASQRARDDPLSAREREVAMLIARGMTNQQIADELVIARSTVERHVVHILDKLTLTGRTQIAVWAATHPQTYGLTLDPQV